MSDRKRVTFLGMDDPQGECVETTWLYWQYQDGNVVYNEHHLLNGKISPESMLFWIDLIQSNTSFPIINSDPHPVDIDDKFIDDGKPVPYRHLHNCPLMRPKPGLFGGKAWIRCDNILLCRKKDMVSTPNGKVRWVTPIIEKCDGKIVEYSSIEEWVNADKELESVAVVVSDDIVRPPSILRKPTPFFFNVDAEPFVPS
jgi:hypothetical protein